MVRQFVPWFGETGWKPILVRQGVFAVGAGTCCIDASFPLSRHDLSLRKPTYNCLPAWLGPEGGALSGEVVENPSSQAPKCLGKHSSKEPSR
jgi:hypothetical protein